MTGESTVRFYEGNKRIGTEFPLLVLVADTTDPGFPYSEHFIFLGLEKTKLIKRRFTICNWDSADQARALNDDQRIFPVGTLVNFQLRNARDHLEFTLDQENSGLSRDVFWNGAIFEFMPSDESALIRLHLFGKHCEEIRKMFELSQIEALTPLDKKLRSLRFVQPREHKEN